MSAPLNPVFLCRSEFISCLVVICNRVPYSPHLSQIHIEQFVFAASSMTLTVWTGYLNEPDGGGEGGGVGICVGFDGGRGLREGVG